jgi:hypothetical protein
VSRTINPNRYTQMTAHEVSRVLARRAGVDSDESIPASFFKVLASSAEAEHRMLVSRSRFTPGELLTTLASDDDRHVRCAVAVNTSATAAQLSAIVGQERPATFIDRFRDAGVRVDLLNAVAVHRNTELDTLARVIVVGGKNSAAGRFARERITIARTKSEIAARKAA